VFVGLCTIDYHRLLYKDFACIGPHSGTGTTPCITANRLSYLLDLRGPSLSVDAACASSLVTVHLSCQSLRSGESDLCLAAGVNLILSPDSTIASAKTRLLSSEGRCRPFDASADGYVRGEGCGVVVLKRLRDALRDGDNVLALVRGSAINQDGLSNSLTAPNGLAQQALIRQALSNANVKPAEISYVEAHAVGTSIGDAIEVKALKSVLLEGREPDRPCWIGSAKPNIGHLEAASGMAALIKVILSLHHEEIPPHLHLGQLNPYITLDDTPLAIPTACQSWSRGETPRYAGISAFGFGGTNAHIILEEAPIPASPAPDQQRSSQQLLTLSAKTPAALRALAQRYIALLDAPDPSALADLCFMTRNNRSHFEHRLAILTGSVAQLRQQLSAFLAQEDAPGVYQGQAKGRKRPKVVYCFAGEGSADVLNFIAGYSLYETQTVFRQTFDRCIELLHFSLEGIGSNHSPHLLLQQVSSNQPVLFALEYALAELWRSWGITPKAVAGQGVGEYVAACVAGVFSLADAIKLVIARTQFRQDPFWSERGGEYWVDIAQSIGYSQPRIPVIFGHTGDAIVQEKDIATMDYWFNALQRDEAEINSSLLSAYDLCLDLGRLDAAVLLNQLGELYGRGAAIDWAGFDRDYAGRRLPLHLSLPATAVLVSEP
jgi:acyl transferase domain-containing protein